MLHLPSLTGQVVVVLPSNFPTLNVGPPHFEIILAPPRFKILCYLDYKGLQRHTHFIIVLEQAVFTALTWYGNVIF